MTRCEGNLGSSKGIKVSGSAAACVQLEGSVSRASLCVLLGLVSIAAGVHPLEEGWVCVVESEFFEGCLACSLLK